MRLLKKKWVMTTIHVMVVALFTVIGLYPVDSGANEQSCENLLLNPIKWRQSQGDAAFPEPSTKYYVIQFQNPSAPGMLILKGQFPHARYIGFTLYSIDGDNTQYREGNPINFRGEVQHLTDVEIQADTGSINPYLNGKNRNALLKRNFTIYIVKEGSQRVSDANTLVVPDGVSAVSLFLRIYVPDDENDPQGGVDLPTITASTESSVTRWQRICPRAVYYSSVTPDDIVKDDRFDESAMLFKDDPDSIKTFKPGDYGLFPNGDCPYLTTPLLHPEVNNSKIAVVRFKAPRFPNTRSGDAFTMADEVRYWSVCMGDWKFTTTTKCIADQDAVIDENGFVNLLISPTNLVTDDNRWNYLPWDPENENDDPDKIERADPILIFRQISPQPGFGGSFDLIETAFSEYDGTIRLNELEAATVPNQEYQAYIPSGRYCTESEFIQNRCLF